MPFVDLSLHHANPSPTEMEAVRRGLTHLMADVLRKRADLTVVAVNVRTPAELSVGGEELQARAWSGRLVAYVTAGTNPDSEKERFLQEAHALLSQHLGTPASPFYIVVQEVPAGGWGYDGRSQADRARVAAQVA